MDPYETAARLTAAQAALAEVDTEQVSTEQVGTGRAGWVGAPGGAGRARRPIEGRRARTTSGAQPRP